MTTETFFSYMWDGVPFACAVVACVLQGLICLVRASEPGRKWFVIGTIGHVVWAIAFAGRTLTNLAPTYFVREALQDYIRGGLLIGAIILCMFCFNHLSYYVVIRRSNPAPKGSNSTSEQHAT